MDLLVTMSSITIIIELFACSNIRLNCVKAGVVSLSLSVHVCMCVCVCVCVCVCAHTHTHTHTYTHTHLLVNKCLVPKRALVYVKRSWTICIGLHNIVLYKIKYRTCFSYVMMRSIIINNVILRTCSSAVKVVFCMCVCVCVCVCVRARARQCCVGCAGVQHVAY